MSEDPLLPTTRVLAAGPGRGPRSACLRGLGQLGGGVLSTSGRPAVDVLAVPARDRVYVTGHTAACTPARELADAAGRS